MATEKNEPRTAALDNQDTTSLDFRVGGQVQCMMGELKGVKGTVTGTRSGGRLLVCLATGFFVEVPRICLRNVRTYK